MKTNNTLALKYRPQKLEDICGHEAVVKTLAGIFKTQEVPNAILLVGPSGVGKTTFSRLIHRYLNCEKFSACGKCKSCSFSGTSHPDYKEVNSGDLGIDGAKELIGQANFMPRYNIRTIMIDEAHLLTSRGTEVLLKPLEEPPANTLWILATTHPEKISNYKAIMGRCSILALNSPTKEQIAGRLATICKAEKIKFDEKTLLTIAEAGGGQVRDAIQILENTNRYVRGLDKEMDKKELRKHIQEQALKISSQESDILAMKVILCLYLNKPRQVMDSLLLVKDHVPFLNSMAHLNQYMINILCCPTHKTIWHTPQCKSLAESVKKRGGVQLKRLIDIQVALVALRDEVVTSQANTLHQITAKLLRLIKTGKKK